LDRLRDLRILVRSSVVLAFLAHDGSRLSDADLIAGLVDETMSSRQQCRSSWRCSWDGGAIWGDEALPGCDPFGHNTLVMTANRQERSAMFGLRCDFCGGPVTSMAMLHIDLWTAVSGGHIDAMMCVPCIVAKLSRDPTPDDQRRPWWPQEAQEGSNWRDGAPSPFINHTGPPC